MSIECGCWRNPETGYLEACKNHERVFMEYTMTIKDLRKELTDAQARVKTLEDALKDITAGWSAVVSRGIANQALAAKEPT